MTPVSTAMNYLAHILLSGNNPQHRIGGLLGDFVKGPLKGDLSEPVEVGIRLHRAIDAWIDQQPEVLAALARFPSPYRRYAGIVLDISYDHLLACNWQQHHPEPLRSFAQDFYQLLDNNRDWLPTAALRFADNAPKYQLLESYADPESIAQTLERIALRLRKPFPLQEASVIVARDATLLAAEFEQFFPRLRAFAAHKLLELRSHD